MTILYCGDPHGAFRHIIEAAGHTKASAVILLGDMEPLRPLHIELAPLIERGVPIFFVHGNHDADNTTVWSNVWGSELADRNIHGRVVELPNGQRLSGLGGVFRPKTVWDPTQGPPRHRTRREHSMSTPRQIRWGTEGIPVEEWASIYPEDVERLADLSADILACHEAPGYHPRGFSLLDTLVQSMGVKLVVHGHHHDRLNSSHLWETQGFRTHGVGLRGITAIDTDGNAEVIVSGELDDARNYRQRYFDAFGGDA